jgi:hypothetical protein
MGVAPTWENEMTTFAGVVTGSPSVSLGKGFFAKKSIVQMGRDAHGKRGAKSGSAQRV